MTALPQPVRGLAEAWQPDHAECGKLAATSIVQRLGYPDTVPAVDFANGAELVGAIQSLGHSDLHAITAPAHPMEILAQIVPQNRYLLALVCCTFDTVLEPCPSQATHWVAAYGTSGEYYNCWLATYAQQNLDVAFDSAGVNVIVWRDGWTPAPSQPSSLRRRSKAMVWTDPNDSRIIHRTYVDNQGLIHDEFFVPFTTTGLVLGWNYEQIGSGAAPMSPVEYALLAGNANVLFQDANGIGQGLWRETGVQAKWHKR